MSGAGNSFGHSFVVTTAGESHGQMYVVIVDGLPSGLALSEDDLIIELNRRRPGVSELTTARREEDTPSLVAGVFEGRTTGAPVAILIPNGDQRSGDYKNIKETFRPGHADLTYFQKYGHYDYRGGGRASARETVARVAAGAIAKKLLSCCIGKSFEILGWTKQIGNINMGVSQGKFNIKYKYKFKFKDIEKSLVRCPDEKSSLRMERLIKRVKRNDDSIGGKAEFLVRGVPAGLGMPVFDKLKADLAKAFASIPAVMAIEFGLGGEFAKKKGSEVREAFQSRSGKIKTTHNHNGGLLGGISSGEDLSFSVTLKPPSSIGRPIKTVNKKGQKEILTIVGRHDPCLLPRFIPVGEAMIALVLADHYIRYFGIESLQRKLK